MTVLLFSDSPPLFAMGVLAKKRRIGIAAVKQRREYFFFPARFNLSRLSATAGLIYKKGASFHTRVGILRRKLSAEELAHRENWTWSQTLI